MASKYAANKSLKERRSTREIQTWCLEIGRIKILARETLLVFFFLLIVREEIESELFNWLLLVHIEWSPPQLTSSVGTAAISYK